MVNTAAITSVPAQKVAQVAETAEPLGLSCLCPIDGRPFVPTRSTEGGVSVVCQDGFPLGIISWLSNEGFVPVT